jgi:hypothetical protein
MSAKQPTPPPPGERPENRPTSPPPPRKRADWHEAWQYLSPELRLQRLEAENAELRGKLHAATERLDLFFAEMRSSPPKVGEPRRWSVRSSGWPWTHAVGSTAEQAVDAVLAEIRRAHREEQVP